MLKNAVRVLTLIGGGMVTFRASERIMEYLVDEKEATLPEVLVTGLVISGIGLWGSVTSADMLTTLVDFAGISKK